MTLVLGSCGRYRLGSEMKSLRKQVTLVDAMRETAVLMIPQVLLQIINLSVSYIRMQSVEVYEGCLCMPKQHWPIMSRPWNNTGCGTVPCGFAVKHQVGRYA